MDIDDIDGATIEKAGFKDKVFEQFFRRLLRAEREFRHRKDARIYGPVADYRGDDKRDLMFEVVGPPQEARTNFTAALTWDDVGRAWYSCKGGGSWRDSILRELGREARNEFDKKGTPPGANVRNRSPKKLLDHVERASRSTLGPGGCRVPACARGPGAGADRQLAPWALADQRS